MSNVVLLILRVPETDDQDVVLKRVNGRLDVSTAGDRYSSINEDAAEKAFNYTSRSSGRIIALQLLTSDLFHWGMNDNILSGAAKMRFIGHVREQVLEKSHETTEMLCRKAMEYGVPLEIKNVETDDPVMAAFEEASGGYDRIFIAKEKEKVFPLFKKSMRQYLQKKITVPIVVG